MSKNAYDLVPYQSNPFPQSQPEQLAVVASLFGLTPKPPSAARVLELGCSAGGNLIPLAARYPDARFIGIDLSQVQVNAGQAAISSLGLSNITIRQEDIARMQRAGELFDYIICHGVYSWVPADVQEAILRVVRENLAPDGVAYVSYNTFPGWKMREVIRDAMMFHTRAIEDPRVKVDQARAIVKLVQEISDPKTAFGRLLTDEAKAVGKAQDYYLFHDHLEANNRPCYFRDFIERAHVHELAYLGEAVLGDMAPQRLGQKVFNALQQLSNGNILATEQYMDFFRNRSFRQTLLVPAAARARIERNLEPSAMERYWSSCALMPLPGVENNQEREFKDEHGRSLKTANTTVQAMMTTWAEAYPQPVSFGSLTEAVARKLEASATAGTSSSASVSEAMLRFVIEGIVKLHVEPREVGRARDASPRAFSAALDAVRRGAPVVPNMRHESTTLGALEREVLTMVDGSLGAAQLRERIVERAKARTLTLMRGTVQLTDEEEVRPVAAQLVLRTLQLLERSALLAPSAGKQVLPKPGQTNAVGAPK